MKKLTVSFKKGDRVTCFGDLATAGRIVKLHKAILGVPSGVTIKHDKPVYMPKSEMHKTWDAELGKCVPVPGRFITESWVPVSMVGRINA